MPEQEGYVGIIAMLTSALELMEEGPARELVVKARAETVRQARQSVSSLEMGLDLGKLLSENDQAQKG